MSSSSCVKNTYSVQFSLWRRVNGANCMFCHTCKNRHWFWSSPLVLFLSGDFHIVIPRVFVAIPSSPPIAPGAQFILRLLGTAAIRGSLNIALGSEFVFCSYAFSYSFLFGSHIYFTQDLPLTDY